MNYSEMSDFEINSEVLAVIEPDVAHMQLSEDQKSFYHCGYDGNGFYETVIPDYCNSWADAGPIIETGNISLTCHQSRGFWAAIFNRKCMEQHENPLRAAMIVFLMMKEAGNV